MGVSAYFRRFALTQTTTGAGEAWVTNLPVGVTYSVTEAATDGWALVGQIGTEGTIQEDVISTATFTNRQTETSATVKKVWDDEDDEDQKRPASITVTLSNGTEVTLNEENDWTSTITGLPRYNNADELIEYTWTEGDMPEGYELSSTSVDGTVTTLTNSYKHEEAKEETEENTEEKSEENTSTSGETTQTSGGKTTQTKAQTTTGTSTGVVKTGDAAMAWPLAAIAVIAFAALVVARRRRNER